MVDAQPQRPVYEREGKRGGVQLGGAQARNVGWTLATLFFDNICCDQMLLFYGRTDVIVTA